MCWAGCDRLAKHRPAPGPAGSRRTTGTSAGARVAGAHPRARLEPGARHLHLELGGDDLDATALLLPELGLVEPLDPRFLATLDAIERELKDGDLLYRYRHHDDFGKPATAFTICAFWYVNALAAVGPARRGARAVRAPARAQDALGLLSEDIDPATGELWGNYPADLQPGRHHQLGVRLSRSWEDAL